MWELLAVIVGIFAAVLATCVAFVTIRIAFGDRQEFEANRRRIRNIGKTVRGEVSPIYDGVTDYRVRAGLAYDKKKNIWIEQGTLSDEAIEAILEYPSR
jgi:hypothetical protein